MIVTTARTPYMRKRKAAFLTVGRQKSQTTACDANHWKANSSKHTARLVAGRWVPDCWVAGRGLLVGLSLLGLSPLCLSFLGLLPPGRPPRCLVLVAGRRVVGSVDSESLRPPLSEAQMREGCATKAVLCLTHLLLCSLPSLQHPAKLK